jgi:hypothetical protein
LGLQKHIRLGNASGVEEMLTQQCLPKPTQAAQQSTGALPFNCIIVAPQLGKKTLVRADMDTPIHKIPAFVKIMHIIITFCHPADTTSRILTVHLQKKVQLHVLLWHSCPWWMELVSGPQAAVATGRLRIAAGHRYYTSSIQASGRWINLTTRRSVAAQLLIMHSI